MDGRVGQVVENLASKCEVLNSNSKFHKKKKKKLSYKEIK
jgi:hypothetical protein